MHFYFLDHLSLFVKCFISLYKPYHSVTLNPHLPHIFETTQPISEQERGMRHVRLAEGCTSAASGKGTHSSIPLILELYFVVP